MLNRSRMADYLGTAAEQGARLVVFPEMASSGYVWDSREEIRPFVETIPGPTTDRLHAVASQYNCYVAAGLAEIDPSSGAYYNSAVLIGPEGIIGSYRKTHLFAADPRWAREGKEEIPVFETPIGKIALLICMDAMYFEPTRIAALKEADIIAFPTNWVGGGNNPPSRTWCLRAKENALYWVAANRSDRERGAQFTGGSGIIGPDGDVQDMQIAGEGIVFGTIMLDAEKRRHILNSRRPHAYQELLLHPYLWKEGETRNLPVPASFEIILVPCKPDNSPLPERLTSAFKTLETPQEAAANRVYVLPELEIGTGIALGEEIIQQLQKLAADVSGFIVAALAEKDTRRDQRIVYLIGQDGIVGQADSVHGNRLNPHLFRTFELPFGRVGILAGEDARYPESYRVLAKQGADIIAVSSNGSEAGATWMRRIWAFENDAIIAAAAPWGSKESLLFLHRQVHQEGDTGEEHFGQTFHPEMLEAVRSRPFMKRLNTHLYDRLVQVRWRGR
ncbi:nitrilase [Paenibacillus sepulcri]|uniref:Nitrilase n=2 Tax=Paenibacillus sepulcri TaxID=359917 RepID=A0ABS7C4W2_9BACL|nr:nitrilase [Paenibacillus sepulcri]